METSDRPLNASSEEDAATTLVWLMLREAIEGLATRDVADQVIHAALRRARRLSVPATPDGLTRFFETHLAPLLHDVLGVNSVDAVRTRIAPLMAVPEAVAQQAHLARTTPLGSLRRVVSAAVRVARVVVVPSPGGVAVRHT